MKGEVVFPNLLEELRVTIREEVQRALEIGGAGGYLNVESAASYLDTTGDAIRSMVKRGQLVPVRRRPYMLFTREELDRMATSEPEEWVA